MVRLIIVLLLLVCTSQAQTLIGLYGDLGQSTYVRKNSRETLSPGTAWSGGATFHFGATKRFNVLVDFGYNEKKYSIASTYYPGKTFTSRYTFKELHLNLGVRFNILKKKHKPFIDLAMNHNYIVERYEKFTFNDDAAIISFYGFDKEVDNCYYSGILCGIGYNYNNIVSISFILKHALSSYESYNGVTRLHMKAVSFCYFIPVLGAKRPKKIPAGSDPVP